MKEITRMIYMDVTCITDEELDVRAVCDAIKYEGPFDDISVRKVQVFPADKITTILRLECTYIISGTDELGADLEEYWNVDDKGKYMTSYLCMFIDEIHDVKVTKHKLFVRDFKPKRRRKVS